MALILLVEDDELISRMLSLRLRAKSHRVEVAENGRKGCEKALSGHYDLVLMDMHMPQMDGREAVRCLRRQGYEGIIAALTASAMRQDEEAAIAAGCDHFISKPIGDDFEQRVAEIAASS